MSLSLSPFLLPVRKKTCDGAHLFFNPYRYYPLPLFLPLPNNESMNEFFFPHERTLGKQTTYLRLCLSSTYFPSTGISVLFTRQALVWFLCRRLLYKYFSVTVSPSSFPPSLSMSLSCHQVLLQDSS
ncbi:hypothetical protein BO70DRAFT_13224 [Aspergillus heteromorphus CBS 117.55]|uniref:Uncharacterized protein n=1 Tax=Aspergillus heteromorphus CBS 117.55 TaxID=1448321 RepID=A0A317X1P6_9EURO|nr:uncharacterized protein BO70DRAFT_13224 [Aspergillus heteromorphus CBS 117.55]PWY92529.1 hypothetical protein BO70DRAFT_13224 [Aspergillus heteromorphus CBS 117.55]